MKPSLDLRYHRVVEALDVAHDAGVGRVGMLDPDPGGREDPTAPAAAKRST